MYIFVHRKAGKKAIEARWHPEKGYDEDTVSSAYNDRSRAEASKRFNVSERKVRIAQEVERKAPDRGPGRG